MMHEPAWVRERYEWVERNRAELALLTMEEQMKELERLAALRQQGGEG